MPELPEVEIAARQLQRWSQKNVLLQVNVNDTRILREIRPLQFRKGLEGKAIIRILRRGKHILAQLDDGMSWWIHLGMSGKLLFHSTKETLSNHSRVEVSSKKGWFEFHDPRLFGRTTVGIPSEVEQRARLKNLGPDALLDVHSGQELRALLSRKRTAIKVALMDQNVIAGLGNIQAAEALFRAQIHPQTRIAELEPHDYQRLLRAIHESILSALNEMSSENVQYLSDGSHITNPFFVYRREGKPCRICAAEVQRLTQQGRRSYFCPSCQKPRA